MSIKDILTGYVLHHISQLVPVQQWFDRPEEAQVWVNVYRVYGVPLNAALAESPFVSDFGLVRAVYVQWDVPYRQFAYRVGNTVDGGLTFNQEFLNWSSTGNGVVLLLITPFSESGGDEAEFAARERVSLVRSVIVAVMGRNAAFELAFDCQVHLHRRTVDRLSPMMAGPNPNVEPPVNPQGAALIGSVLDNLSALDEATQNRVELALRWYERSLGEDQLVRDIRETAVDEFINCWVALEALVSAGEQRPAGQIIKRLAKIHGIKTQQAGSTFPVSRAYKLRKEIFHRGELVSVRGDWHGFLSDIFVDLLFDTLKLPSGQNTAKYLDGPASGLIQ